MDEFERLYAVEKEIRLGIVNERNGKIEYHELKHFWNPYLISYQPLAFENDQLAQSFRGHYSRDFKGLTKSGMKMPKTKIKKGYIWYCDAYLQDMSDFNDVQLNMIALRQVVKELSNTLPIFGKYTVYFMSLEDDPKCFDNFLFFLATDYQTLVESYLAEKLTSKKDYHVERQIQSFLDQLFPNPIDRDDFILEIIKEIEPNEFWTRFLKRQLRDIEDISAWHLKNLITDNTSAEMLNVHWRNAEWNATYNNHKKETREFSKFLTLLFKNKLLSKKVETIADRLLICEAHGYKTKKTTLHYHETMTIVKDRMHSH